MIADCRLENEDRPFVVAGPNLQSLVCILQSPICNLKSLPLAEESRLALPMILFLILGRL